MLAMVALLAVADVAANACADSDRFTFRVERARTGAVDGLEVQVEAGGPSGLRLSADSVRGGLIRVCIVGAAPGEMVDVRLNANGPRAFRLLYPPGGRVTITHQGSPSIVVCEVHGDCELLTLDEATRLIGRAKPVAAKLSSEEKESLFRAWLEKLEEQGMQSGRLVEALQRKERQIGASRAASELLSKFSLRAREVFDRFRRHAHEAIDYPSPGPSAQINEAVARYNPVFDEMKEKGDSYRKATADYWGASRSAEFQRLLQDALAIHAEIYTLNDLATLINDCRNGMRSCADRAAARTRVLDGVDRVGGDVDARLGRFDRSTGSFLEAMNEALFEATPRGAARGTDDR